MNHIKDEIADLHRTVINKISENKHAAEDPVLEADEDPERGHSGRMQHIHREAQNSSIGTDGQDCRNLQDVLPCADILRSKGNYSPGRFTKSVHHNIEFWPTILGHVEQPPSVCLHLDPRTKVS